MYVSRRWARRLFFKKCGFRKACDLCSIGCNRRDLIFFLKKNSIQTA
jgi:hypothetical protein